ncbi:TetR family transcriptional regulator C-terminal domain-containing protein [Coralliovum pocilloporae]|uniref:TetR family transcriptional regulator C-terminal domain-containing protein n=1 Tax=Coralliovum pocilloporae TaxID=3066369 RepID=UPI003306E442
MSVTETRKLSRIQKERRKEILAAALDVFSRDGFRGASINTIAKEAEMSTPRLLYHFSGKEELYHELLKSVLLLWLGPLNQIDASGQPVEEILDYIRRKLRMSQHHPRESRLFASAVLLGAQRAHAEVFDSFRVIFDDKISLLSQWMDDGKLARQDPHHLIYSIWATTQHYADFEVQIVELSPEKMDSLFTDAEAYLVPMYRKLLTPDT